MMFGPRLRLSFALRLDGCVHLGTGRRRTIGRQSGAEPHGNGGEERELALVHRGIDGRPFIPGPTLKGILNAAWTGAEEDKAAAFGEALNAARKTGRVGRLWVHHALGPDPKKQPVDASGLRGKDVPKADQPDDGFVATHVRIDAASGAAEANKLFSLEMVGPGVVFETAWDWLLMSDDPESPSGLAVLADILAPLAAGLPVGKGAGHGGGRIRLQNETLEVKRLETDPQTGIAALRQAPGIAASLRRLLAAANPVFPGRHIRLLLKGDGPFISMRGDAPGRGEAGERREVEPLEHDGKPVLWGRSVSGALRARARWLQEVERHKAKAAGHPDPYAPGRAWEVRGDDRDLERVLSERKAVASTNDVARLSSVERLFGVTGWRRLVAVDRVECRSAGVPGCKLTSVSIDRFTGGGRDGFLFTERTYLDPEFIVDLTVGTRGALPEDQAAADRALFDLLLDDLTRNGLELGHGASKGFGWFQVQILEDSEQAESGERAHA
ncbi:MAG: hypothetical protein GVY13_03495 [Alphaproteobacteria bacterium]|jgi:CRISPR/Cas system CSM-associated protein Csm3 (group 7 of RAMP superfamily)|nr:hypothetical protein [Alphaproteobacteria bacterium]